jgi:hypothetical protein
VGRRRRMVTAVAAFVVVCLLVFLAAIAMG